MVVVEHLLNLLWLTVVCGLFATVFRCGRKGMLRCSLPVALGATVLLAVVLFPALSMTDDLQRAKMDTETSCRHLADSFLLGSRENQPVAPVAVLPFLLMLLLFGSRLLSAEFLARLADPFHGLEERVSLQLAPRAPPMFARA